MNEVRIVRQGATAPEVCIHNVRLGPNLFCTSCPSFKSLQEQAREIFAIVDPMSAQLTAMYTRLYKLENQIEAISNIPSKTET